MSFITYDPTPEQAERMLPLLDCELYLDKRGSDSDTWAVIAVRSGEVVGSYEIMEGRITQYWGDTTIYSFCPQTHERITHLQWRELAYGHYVCREQVGELDE